MIAEIGLRASVSPEGRLVLEVIQPDTPTVGFATGGLLDSMAAEAMPLRRKPIRTALAQAVVNHLRDRVAGAGGDLSQFDTVIEGLESERPILDWLKNGGFDALVKFILELIAALK